MLTIATDEASGTVGGVVVTGCERARPRIVDQRNGSFTMGPIVQRTSTKGYTTDFIRIRPKECTCNCRCRRIGRRMFCVVENRTIIHAPRNRGGLGRKSTVMFPTDPRKTRIVHGKSTARGLICLSINAHLAPSIIRFPSATSKVMCFSSNIRRFQRS